MGDLMSAIRNDELWQIKAACRGPQAAVFFPPSYFERKDEKLERETRAKAICAACVTSSIIRGGAMPLPTPS
jgi:WhiB family redox-sensing transcriptional regulator